MHGQLRHDACMPQWLRTVRACVFCLIQVMGEDLATFLHIHIEDTALLRGGKLPVDTESLFTLPLTLPAGQSAAHGLSDVYTKSIRTRFAPGWGVPCHSH